MTVPEWWTVKRMSRETSAVDPQVPNRTETEVIERRQVNQCREGTGRVTLDTQGPQGLRLGWDRLS